jgi:HK97 family phage major capsid protein
MNRKEYLAKRSALIEEAEKFLNEDKMAEYEAKETEIKALDEQYEKHAKAQANINVLKDAQPIDNTLISISNTLDNKPVTDEDKYNSLEYRKAFMNYCKTGSMDKKFLNLDDYNSTTEAAATIPTSIMQELISKMEVYGNIYARVRKLNVQGGVNFPILSLKPTATWITEAAVSDRKKSNISTNVSFSYYGLECRIATSLLASIVTLPMFEATMVTLIIEAMVKAIDIAIIKGDGAGEPLGITLDPRIPVANVITLSSVDFSAWDGWKKKVFSKIPLGYRAGGSFIMAAGTFEGYIDGMVDANGQPMGRVNYGIVDAPQERFGGREVILVEDDVVAPYDTAGVGDIVAIFCKLSDYAINSNMTMQMSRWFDQDKNQWVDKAILICDGKILDANGVLVIKKGA